MSGGDPGLPRQPMGQRPHPVTLPRPRRQRLGRQLDELGLQHVEMAAHLPQPVLDRSHRVEYDTTPTHPIIVHQYEN